MKIKIGLIVILVPLLTLLANSPSQAGSKSATIRVSCTILPAIQLSSSPVFQGLTGTSLPNQPAAGASRQELAIAGQNSQIHIDTNLGNQYRVTEAMLKHNENLVKLYSVTAL